MIRWVIAGVGVQSCESDGGWRWQGERELGGGNPPPPEGGVRSGG